MGVSLASSPHWKLVRKGPAQKPKTALRSGSISTGSRRRLPDVNPLERCLNLGWSPERLLKGLSLSEVELALQTVDQSLIWDETGERAMLELDPREVPPSLRHLSPEQWRVMVYLLQSLWLEMEESPVH